jgi:hypothetical protein
VQRRFDDSPLAPVGETLAREITEIRASAQARFTTPGAVESFAGHTSSILDALPLSFGERFTFDSQLIAALRDECSLGGVRLSNTLIPKLSQTWGHQTVSMPSIDRRSAHVIDLIHLPGEDDLGAVDLLAYPFLCHELGHNLLFKQGEQFARDFSQVLDALVSGLQRQTLGVQGSAKQVALSTIDQIRQYWTPTANHYNWAHEIAVDVIALWTCGPAYLATLHDVIEPRGTNPYQLGQSHPPYEVRAKAMIAAATQTGWAYYTGDFETLIDGWPRSEWGPQKTNLYTACADARLVEASVAAALEACRSLALPACTPARVDAIREKLQQQELPELGTEAIIAAWLTRSATDEDTYEAWERDTVRRHVSDLTE